MTTPSEGMEPPAFDSLFTWPVESPTDRRRPKKPCRVPGCTEPVLYGSGYIYCAAHVCDYDTCMSLVAERGRCKRHAYCRTEGCPKMRRDAQAAKYCEDHATCIDYELRGTVPYTTTGICLACDETVTQRRPVGDRKPLLLCRDHRHLQVITKRWRRLYNIDDEEIRRLIHHAECWICGGDLRWRLANRDRGKLDTIHVDHDHRCCPGERSCGLCVRGLAHDPCNRRLGHLEALLKDIGADAGHRLIDRLG